jgi:DNA-binding NarL/FixJ family response regulator
MSQDQIRLFIIDDHFLINDGFNQLFDPEVDGIKTVGSAVSVESAVKQIHALDVHIIILDLYLKLFDPIFNTFTTNSRLFR